MSREISYQIVTDLNSIKRIVELQERVWAKNVVTSLPQMVAAIHHGGVVIGAFDQGKVVGFCYGFPGYKKGENYLFSHMMGIDPDYRDQGIGRQLKFEQRAWAIKYGYDTICWTFDPLEARNAYLNLSKLGGYVDTYIESYYGEMSDPINNGLPTDRFILKWELQSERVQRASAGEAIYDAAWNNCVELIEWELVQNGMNSKPSHWHSIQGKASQDSRYCIAVPKHIHIMKQENIELAKRWRVAIRQTCQDAFWHGYKVVGMLRFDGPVHYYVLQKDM